MGASGIHLNGLGKRMERMGQRQFSGVNAMATPDLMNDMNLQLEET